MENGPLSALDVGFHLKSFCYENPRDFLSCILIGTTGNKTLTLSPNLFIHDLYYAEWQACVKFFEKERWGQVSEADHRAFSSVATGT